MEINFFEILIFTLGIFIYFLPSYIARKHRKYRAVLVLNLLLGWTFLGWIGALMLSMQDVSKNMLGSSKIKNKQTDEFYDNELAKLRDLYYNGFLREPEFLIEVNKILNKKES